MKRVSVRPKRQTPVGAARQQTLDKFLVKLTKASGSANGPAPASLPELPGDQTILSLPTDLGQAQPPLDVHDQDNHTYADEFDPDEVERLVNLVNLDTDLGPNHEPFEDLGDALLGYQKPDELSAAQQVFQDNIHSIVGYVAEWVKTPAASLSGDRKTDRAMSLSALCFISQFTVEELATAIIANTPLAVQEILGKPVLTIDGLLSLPRCGRDAASWWGVYLDVLANTQNAGLYVGSSCAADVRAACAGLPRMPIHEPLNGCCSLS